MQLVQSHLESYLKFPLEQGVAAVFSVMNRHLGAGEMNAVVATFPNDIKALVMRH